MITNMMITMPQDTPGGSPHGKWARATSGSGPLVVMVSVAEQDAFAEQVWFGSPVLLPFDHFDAVDVAFDGA
jgi:hypothetical protein